MYITGKEKLTLPEREEIRVVLESDSTEVMRSHCAPTQLCLPLSMYITGKEKLTLPEREEVRVVLESDSTEVMRSHCAPTQLCLP